jgi:hypothetical protein
MQGYINGLQEKHNILSNQVNILLNLVYILVGLSGVLIIVTMYFGTRKPQTIPQTEMETSKVARAFSGTTVIDLKS